MGLLNLFRKPKPVNGVSQPGNEMSNQYPDIPEQVFIEKDVSAAKQENKEEAREANIETLNRFLDRNLEPQGYDDALINPDTSNMEENILAIKNEFQRTIRTIKQFYSDFIREIDFHIESRSRKGMVDTVDELRMKKTIAETHIERIKEIEADAKNNTGESQGIIISYIKGFKNGLAAISHHHVLNKKI